jgi:hypothetical protein
VYGERIAAMAAAARLPHTVVETAWTSPPDVARLAKEAAAPDVEAIAVVHHETTTGLLNPVAEVGRVARAHGKLLLVDSVSGLAGDALDVEAVGADLVVGTGGKCIQGFPGLSFVLVRESAPVAAKLMAFDERRRANAGGTFIDSTVIAKWEYRKAGDLLSTVSGVDVQRQNSAAYLTGSRATQSMRTGPSARPVPCFMDVYLDGAPVALSNTMFDINSIGLTHVAAIEVYSSTARIPSQYNRTSGGCGVVLLWTK